MHRQTNNPTAKHNASCPMYWMAWHSDIFVNVLIEMTALKSDEKHKEVHTVPTTTLDSPLDY